MTIIATLIAGVGIGTIMAALIGWQVAISNHRQAWINALRDDLALYLEKLEIAHGSIGDFLRGNGNAKLEMKKREARIALLHVYWRIVLRLNRKEKLHRDLKEKLESLLIVSTQVPDPVVVGDAVDLARQVLKREWEVTKLGILAGPVMRCRDRQPLDQAPAWSNEEHQDNI